MALTTIPSELSSVSGIADSSDATAITIDSSENVTFNGELIAPNGATEGYHIKQTGGTATPRLTNDANNWTIIRPGASGSDVAINNYANSANLVTFTDEGYVGIGETSPDNKLHITGANWNNAHIKIERTDVGGSNDPGLVFKSAAGANDAYGLGGIWFQNALDSNAYALIRARTDDASGTSGKLEFVTSTSAVGNATTPRMVIDGDGTFNVYSDSSGGTPNLTIGTSGVAIFKPKDNTANIASFDTDSAGQTTGYIAFLTRGTVRGYIGNGSALSSNYNLDTDFHIRSEGTRMVFLTGGNSPKLVIDGSAGNVLPHGDATQNLGSTSKRWDNLYVGDMHFSNEGSEGNEVDGTTGNWTLQEGEEHLYILNNKSGKKFKFSLEEVE